MSAMAAEAALTGVYDDDAGTRKRSKCAFLPEAFLLLAFVAVTAAFIAYRPLSDLVAEEIDRHSPCPVCLGKPGHAWCGESGTNGVCQPTSGDLPDTCVTDTAFCGAPECAKLQIVPGVRPTPYWVMVGSSALSIVLSVAVNAVKLYIWLPLKRCCAEEKLDYKDRFVVVLKIFGAMDPMWYSMLVTATVVHFGYLAYEVTVSPLYAQSSHWQRYEALYLLWFNSGTLLTLLPFFSQLTTYFFFKKTAEDLHYKVADNQVEAVLFPLVGVPGDEIITCKHYLFAFVYGVAVALLLPPFVTHIIPCLIAFLPITLAAILISVIGFCFSLALSVCLPLQRWWVVALLAVACRATGTVATLVAFQTMANYAVLFYGGVRWDHAVSIDFTIRQTKCWANAFANNIEVYNVALVGLVLS